MTEEAVVVVAGGAPPPREAALEVAPGTTVIAADGGLENARVLGLTATTAIGDFDSVSPDALEAAAAAGVELVRHPEAKDATDLELALDAALALDPARIHVLAGDGGRLDHLLAALLLLASPRYGSVPIDASFGPAHVHVVRGERTLAGEPGQLALARRAQRPCGGRDDGGPRVPARGRDARARLEPRRVERLHGGQGDRAGRPRRAARDPPRPGGGRLVPIWHKATLAAFGTAIVLAVGACGGGESPTEVVLVTHDSFVMSDELKRDFEQESGLTLKVLQAGDAGEVVAKALLTAGNPQGDVLFGVDNNLLSRALDGDLFESYESPALETVDEQYVLDPEHRVTPIDHGEVCLNYDKAWFAEHEVAPPTTLDDLVKPAYEKLLVVENPATSTPGLAFMLATIAQYGDGSTWETYWRALRANGVQVVDGWEEAYNVRFSGSAGKGDRPIVVSYASSPPAEVDLRGAPPEGRADRRRRGHVLPTGRARRRAARRAERGRREEARGLHALEALPGGHSALDVRVPREPGRRAAAGVRPATPRCRRARSTCLPAEIGANREQWVDEWTRIVLR